MKSGISKMQKDLDFIHGDKTEDVVFHLLQLLASHPKTFLRAQESISLTRRIIELQEYGKADFTDDARSDCGHFDADSGACFKHESGCFNCSDFSASAGIK